MSARTASGDAPRDAAIGILKPAARDLSYGLGLHREAIVVEAYGLMPHAAVPTGRIRRMLLEGATSREVSDEYERLYYTLWADDTRLREELTEILGAAGVTAVFMNAGQEDKPPLEILDRIAWTTHLIDNRHDVLAKAVTGDDITRAKRESKTAYVFSTCTVPLSGLGQSVEEELAPIVRFRHLGVRAMHLTYNRQNLLGTGCAEAVDSGLSDFGRKAVKEMNRRGVIVDVAHSGWRTSLEAAAASSAPVMASHTACAALNQHSRAKPDEAIRAIADGGGVVGICAVPAFLGGSGDINAFLDHIDHVVKTVGAAGAAIGTDNNHQSRHLDLAGVEALLKDRKTHRPFAGLWPENEPLFDPRWQEDPMRSSLAWTNWPLFTVGLVQRGYKDDEIRAIIGGNVMRVMEAAEKAAARADSEAGNALP